MITTDLFKKVLHTGVGAVSTATERVKKTIDTTVGEINKVAGEAETKGKERMEGVTSEFKTRREEVSNRFQKIIDTVLGQLDLPNRTEAESLNAKIAELEEKLATAEKPARKATTRKTTVKKAATTTPAAKKTVVKKTVTKVAEVAGEIKETVKA